MLEIVFLLICRSLLEQQKTEVTLACKKHSYITLDFFRILLSVAIDITNYKTLACSEFYVISKELCLPNDIKY